LFQVLELAVLLPVVYNCLRLFSLYAKELFQILGRRRIYVDLRRLQPTTPEAFRFRLNRGGTVTPLAATALLRYGHRYFIVIRTSPVLLS
jgi:hypothetical protein